MSEKLSENDKARVSKTFEELKSREYTENDIKKVLNNEANINKKAKKGPLAKYKETITLFFSMVKDSFSKKYTDVSKVSIVVIIGALVYVINPFDIIPDFVPVLGLVDDTLMLSLAVNFTKREVARYKEWKINAEKLNKMLLQDAE